MGYSKLAKYIEALERESIYCFQKKGLSEILGASESSIHLSVNRLIKKGKVVRVIRGLYLIVPPQYSHQGAPPPDWFIDDLMEFLGLPYYVGLLTAAGLFGAAHQQPGEFQVLTCKQLRSIKVGRSMIKFYFKKELTGALWQKIKSETGYFHVSRPEVTAFDLLKYPLAAGYIHNTATVLMELSERINPEELVRVAGFFELPVVQRGGYLLDRFGEKEVAGLLRDWLSLQNVRKVPLRPGQPLKGHKIDPNWHVIINEKVEVDR